MVRRYELAGVVCTSFVQVGGGPLSPHVGNACCATCFLGGDGKLFAMLGDTICVVLCNCGFVWVFDLRRCFVVACVGSMETCFQYVAHARAWFCAGLHTRFLSSGLLFV